MIKSKLSGFKNLSALGSFFSKIKVNTEVTRINTSEHNFATVKFFHTFLLGSLLLKTIKPISLMAFLFFSNKYSKIA